MPTDAASRTEHAPMLKDRYEAVLQRVGEAARRSGRRPEEIVTVAVTKNASMDVVRELFDLGHRHFGENRVQQLAARAAQIDEYRDRIREHPGSSGRETPDRPNWHMVGSMQRNKVRKAIENARLIHSLDSLRLAEEIQSQSAKRDRITEVLIEVNFGEEQKGGIAAPAVRHLVDQMGSMLNVRVRGLMCMAPNTEDEALIRNTFERCHEIFEDVRKFIRESDRIDVLSMGMSNDFEMAIECGANLVRVGNAIVGDPVVESGDDEPAPEDAQV
ncbi:MAG: YggS family pyridoxal phosphate-dependent enzyme [Phycisphaerales bacterium]|nr:YggS family pyridoxal phosphate-dependent enzyme [Phycisphaerales bacterium]MDG2132236.1 YggS family pyridoxal phosphate-dependent enzyme [Phycisphaerales bacterium]